MFSQDIGMVGLPDYLKTTDYQITGSTLGNAIPIAEVNDAVPAVTAVEDTVESITTESATIYNAEKKITCKRYSLFKTQR